MDNPKRIYELLLDYCSADAVADRILIGLVWTLCQSGNSIGLSMSPQFATRTLSWSGDLAGKPLIDLAAWILEWEPYQASVAMSAINSCINARAIPDSIGLDNTGEQANLAVFDYFLPQLTGKKVVVIGRYPGIERYQDQIELKILEKQTGSDDYPDAACEYLIPKADWVFLTASSIPNKTFPRLAELATDAKTVLMGPTTPWLPQLHEFGIDYLAGVEVTDGEILYRTVAEGGGKRIFNHGLRYRIAELSSQVSLNWLKQQIADCAAEKGRLTQRMDAWYGEGNRSRFPGYPLLELTNTRLSRMDSSYKGLWDIYGDDNKLTG
ncbi:MAG: DUF364 domain-containing protein [Methylococcaceae bacterium]|nr:DUF364 domain-containing protein [Methylococcaceae bacterium]